MPKNNVQITSKAGRYLAFFLVLMLVMSTLVGCSTEKKQSAKASFNEDPLKITIDFEMTGDQVTKMVQTSTMDLSDVAEDVRQQVRTAGEKAKANYDKIAAANYRNEEKDNIYTEVITIDLSKKENVKVLVENGLIPVSDKNINTISFAQTKAAMEPKGWVFSE